MTHVPAFLNGVSLHVGDCLQVLRELPDESVHCCVTSPPYWNLRDYQVDGQLGLEKTPEEYVAKMVEVFREVRRVLRNDATLWINLGDSYASTSKNRTESQASKVTGLQGGLSTQLSILRQQSKIVDGLKPKDMVGIPWRVAFALQANGWWLRQDIIWHKPNPMPESVTDRCTKSHEYVFLLAKSERYYFDAQAIAEQCVAGNNGSSFFSAYDRETKPGLGRGPRVESVPGGTRNKRSVWTVATKPFAGAHFATFPESLVRPMIRAGTSEHGCCPQCGSPWARRLEDNEPRDPVDCEGKNASQDKQHSARRMLANMRAARQSGHPHDNPFPSKATIGWDPTCECGRVDVEPCIVLDPFFGAGTTAVVARKLERRCIGIELNPEYMAIARGRLRQRVMFFC